MEVNNTPKAPAEIDLVELAQKLWRRKALILGITLLTTGLAAAYAWLSTPIYRAQIAVIPPALSDIAGFNLGRNKDIGLEPFKVDDVYGVFTRNLQSDSSRRRFYREVYLPSLSEERKAASQSSLYEEFSKTISISAPTAVQPGRFVFGIENPSADAAAEWARLYIEDVEKRSVDEMLQNARSEIEVRGRNITQQIDSVRDAARVRREDRDVQLKEALRVAEAIGLQNPPVIAGQMNDQLSAIMEGNLTYMRGSKALKAEIDALQRRTSDDPFVPELRELQEQYALYAALRVEPDRVAVYRLDGAIEVPDQPIKPKRALIVALGVVLGLMLGVFAALVSIVVHRKRN